MPDATETGNPYEITDAGENASDLAVWSPMSCRVARSAPPRAHDLRPGGDGKTQLTNNLCLKLLH